MNSAACCYVAGDDTSQPNSVLGGYTDQEFHNDTVVGMLEIRTFRLRVSLCHLMTGHPVRSNHPIIVAVKLCIDARPSESERLFLIFELTNKKRRIFVSKTSNSKGGFIELTPKKAYFSRSFELKSWRFSIFHSMRREKGDFPQLPPRGAKDPSYATGHFLPVYFFHRRSGSSKGRSQREPMYSPKPVGISYESWLLVKLLVRSPGNNPREKPRFFADIESELDDEAFRRIRYLLSKW